MEEENRIGSSRVVELNEDTIENETEETRNIKDKVEEPKVGMTFNSIDDIMKYYTRYGKEKGFAVAKRSSKKGDDGEVRYVTVACNRAGKPRYRSSNPLKLQPQLKTDCKAQLRVVLCPDGKWILTAMALDHNHGLSPSKSRFYKCHRILEPPQVKKRIALNDIAGIRMKNNFNSFVVETHQQGGHENLSFLEKGCRIYIDKLRRLHLGEGRLFDKMCNAFYEVADLATKSEDMYEKVMTRICELKRELKNEEDVNKHSSLGMYNDLTSSGDDLVISKESRNVLDPLVVRQKGQPLSKRKHSKVEKAIKKKKMKTTSNEGNVIKQAETSITVGNVEKDSVNVGNVHSTTPAMRIEALGTQQSYNLNGHHHPFWKAGHDLAAIHPTSSTGIFYMNDIVKAENPRLHKDGRIDTS
jgi:hypothetical protein